MKGDRKYSLDSLYAVIAIYPYRPDSHICPNCLDSLGLLTSFSITFIPVFSHQGDKGASADIF
jgi:hypothetical protein